MPLYLVRWGTTLTVSLVRASSEGHLMDILDEVADPGSCSWKVYTGPIFVDLAVPIEFTTTATDSTELVRAKNVKIQRPAKLEGPPLEVREPDDCETVYEMKETIMRQAYPVLAKAVYDGEDDELDVDAVCVAVAKDLEAQSIKLQGVGIALGEDVKILRTRALCFRLTANDFKEISVTKANEFCAGLCRLKPDLDGLVRLAFVDVAFRRRKATSGVISVALKLRTDPKGAIITPHRADAFDGVSNEGQRAPLHKRRNEAVSWTLSPTERSSLQSAVGERVGQKVPLTVRHE